MIFSGHVCVLRIVVFKGILLLSVQLVMVRIVPYTIAPALTNTYASLMR